MCWRKSCTGRERREGSHLLGQNVNGYRHDGHDFADLLHAVAAIDGIGRIRYTTSHPLEFSDAIIQAHADIPQLVKYLHLPVQAGSDRILAAMKRNHTALEYKSRIRRLKAAVPDILISSDFIVGFPGETDKDFEQTMKLIEDVGFDFSYSFVYSARPGPRRRTSPTTHRMRSRNNAGDPAAAHQPAGLREQPTNGRHHPAHPRQRLFEKDRACCRAVPSTIASSTSAATTRD